MNPKASKDLLRQEVLELTALLREEDVLEDLREVLLRAGHRPSALLLGGFLEDAAGYEAGVLVSSQGAVFEFERDLAKSNDFKTFNAVQDPSTLLHRYPALLVAIEMSREKP